MKTYYIGTTMECLRQILEDGLIRTSPPKRVWEGFSEDFIYLIPSENEHEGKEILLHYALEQATFALSKLAGTMRVIIEVKGIDEETLIEDEDARSIYSLKHPYDIPVSQISQIHVSTEDVESEVCALSALLWYRRSDWDAHRVLNLFYLNRCNEAKTLDDLKIRGVELIELKTLLEDSKVEEMYWNLSANLLEEAELMTMSIQEVLEAYPATS